MTDDLKAAWEKIPMTFRYKINGEPYIEVQRGDRGRLVPFNATTFAEWCGSTPMTATEVNMGYDAAAEAAQRISDAKEGFDE